MNRVNGASDESHKKENICWTVIKEPAWNSIRRATRMPRQTTNVSGTCKKKKETKKQEPPIGRVNKVENRLHETSPSRATRKETQMSRVT